MKPNIVAPKPDASHTVTFGRATQILQNETQPQEQNNVGRTVPMPSEIVSAEVFQPDKKPTLAGVLEEDAKHPVVAEKTPVLPIREIVMGNRLTTFHDASEVFAVVPVKEPELGTEIDTFPIPAEHLPEASRTYEPMVDMISPEPQRDLVHQEEMAETPPAEYPERVPAVPQEGQAASLEQNGELVLTPTDGEPSKPAADVGVLIQEEGVYAGNTPDTGPDYESLPSIESPFIDNSRDEFLWGDIYLSSPETAQTVTPERPAAALEESQGMSVPVGVVEQAIAKLAEKAEGFDTKEAETVRGLLDSITIKAEEVREFSLNSGGQSEALREEVKEELDEMFAQLFKIARVEYAPAIIEPLIRFIVHEGTANLVSAADEIGGKSGDRGTHEALKQLLAVTSGAKRKFLHAYSIGRSALRLYSTQPARS